MPRPKEGDSKRCFCPSVRPSVPYIANNWRTQRPSVLKFGMKVSYLRCDSHTSLKVKRSKVNSSGPLMLTHVLRLPNASLPHTAGWRISRPFRYQFAPNLHAVLMRNRNIATEPNFRTSLSKSRILSPKNSNLSISAV